MLSLVIVGRGITKRKSNTKRHYEAIVKKNTKEITANTIDIIKLEELYFYCEQ